MIPFSPPRIDQLTINEIIDTLKSGWITTGPKTKLFEKRLSEYCGNQRTLCVNSATAGLELVLRWFGVGEGDEVILPAYTYCATANVVIHCGAEPVFVDINPDDFNIAVKEIAKAINWRTKVIMPVDIAGFPCDYDLIRELVEKPEIRKKFISKTEMQNILNRILILSDSAHSLGAVYKTQKAGTLADISVFSFHAVKNLTTAEGGAIAFNLCEPFNNDELYQFFNTFALHGQSKDALEKTKGSSWEYDVLFAGFKANMTDLAASMGLVELARYQNDMLPKRRAIFEQYSAALAKYDWAELPIFENNEKTSSFHAYLLRIKGIDEQQRKDIIQKIFDRQVSVNVHFKPIPLLSYYKDKGYNINNYPVSYESYKREISLPVYYDLEKQQVEQVIEALAKSVEEILYRKRA